MSGSMLWRFIRKELHFNLGLMAASSAVGLVGMALANFGDAGAYAASVLFVAAMIIAAIFVCMRSIFGERKERAIAFALSFPISPGQYIAAKVMGAMACFLLPSLVIGLGGVVLLGFTRVAHGLIPISVASWLCYLDMFCLMLAATLFSDSDTWTGITTAAVSISTAFFFYFVLRTPSIHSMMNSPTAVWNGAVIGIITIELAVMAVIAAVVWYFLARKRDFI